jgi:hypothetical protein
VLDKNNIGITRVFAYYDELHKYINPSLRLQIEELHNLDIIKGITALTASPDKIFEDVGFWSKIRLIQLDDFSDKNYVGYKDMIFNCLDDFYESPYIRPHPFDFEVMDAQTLGFIENVLKKFPEILGDDTRSFIPAHIRRIGHNAVRDLVFKIKNNAVVVVLNGFEKTLQYNDILGNKKTLALTSCDEEVCETISKLVLHHNLARRPIVITGLLCVGMGQTLTHKSLGSFTSAIFGHMDLTNDDIYQLFGRITGRMKDWGSKYIETQVYCPTTIMNRCIVMEECARNMASDHNGEVVSQETYREPMSELGDIGKSAIDNIRTQKKKKIVKVVAEDTDKDSAIFDTQYEAICLGKTIGCKFTRRGHDNAPAELIEDGKNPTREQLLKRMWGINNKNRGRMIPMDDKKWCVYWRPSLIRSE